jgi:hypothetical protein
MNIFEKVPKNKLKITFNVGGTIYMTTLATLLQRGENFLSLYVERDLYTNLLDYH